MLDPVIEERKVDNPLLTSFSQFIHSLDHAPQALKNAVQVNVTTLLGGAARFHLNEAQQKAAARFKSLYERSMLGGSKAIDPSQTAVDGGYRNPEGMMEIGADARRELIRLQSQIDITDYKKLEYVIIGEHGPTTFARTWYNKPKPDGETIRRACKELRAITDKLAIHMGYATR